VIASVFAELLINCLDDTLVVANCCGQATIMFNLNYFSNKWLSYWWNCGRCLKKTFIHSSWKLTLFSTMEMNKVDVFFIELFLANLPLTSCWHTSTTNKADQCI